MWILVFAACVVYCALAGLGIVPHEWYVTLPIAVAGAVVLGIISAPSG